MLKQVRPAPKRNGLDDNCDGLIDEPYVELGRPCEWCREFARRRFRPEDGQTTTCDAPSIAPSDGELCNGLDDNCNGTVDETFPRLNSICTVGEGACERAGIFICSADGRGDTCNATAGEPSPELCNRLDDNCDGRIDENFPTLGERCNVGIGLCRRSGVLVCNDADAMAPPVCDAEEVAPAVAGLDTCDYQDDDCDGKTDEDFVDANGQYSGVANCGACGTDCTALWAPSPAAFGITPTCAQVAGITQCSFDCLPGFLDADGIANNGCELQPDNGAIYVQTPSNDGVDAANCGTVQAPCATINFALQRASEDSKPRVRVAEGAYRETVQLLEGIDVLGGHQRVIGNGTLLYLRLSFSAPTNPSLIRLLSKPSISVKQRVWKASL